MPIFSRQSTGGFLLPISSRQIDESILCRFSRLIDESISSASSSSHVTRESHRPSLPLPATTMKSQSQLDISTPITTNTIQSNKFGPTAVRFAISGVLGNAVFWGLDMMLFPLIVRTTSSVRLKRIVTSMPNNKFFLVGGNASTWINNNAASVSFFVAYLLDIAVQRELRHMMPHITHPVVSPCTTLLCL